MPDNTELRAVMMPSIKSVLCPVDFSEGSAHALEQAVAVASWYNARLTALHVYSPLRPVPGLPVDHVPESELQPVRREATAFVASVLPPGTTVDVVVACGQPARTILEQAADLRADVIVMGTHGSSGFERVLLGSVTEKVLRKATCPVLTVPPRRHVTSQLPFVRVLCAVDFSEWSLAAVELAASLARQSSAALELLHVVEWPWEEPPAPTLAELPREQAAALLEFRRYVTASATSRLESLVPVDTRTQCVVTTRISHGRPYVEILRVAAEENVDLIVLGVHGRRMIDLAMFGSTTNQVVRRATCPVVTLRR
jgi:nucleotide-binding universal stress UspA family protein